MEADTDFDVVIVGGGPAGSSAALALGRACRRVLLCDAGTPRNAAARAMHNFVTRDGVSPQDFRRSAREELRRYATVRVRDARATDVAAEGAGLRVALEGDAPRAVRARRVLLALGMVDVLPEIPGLGSLWGESVFICPYCHGWEHRDRAWGVVATDAQVAEHALVLTAWTRDLTVFTEGAPLPDEVTEKLRRAGIAIESRRMRALHGDGPRLAAVELADGTRVARDALVLRPPQRPAPLVDHLGLAREESGVARVDARKESSMARVHVAGDAASMMQAALPAAADGAMAAVMINHLLAVETAAERSSRAEHGS